MSLKNKHLEYQDRTYIEIGLNQGRSLTEIAKDLNKDLSTISKEIQKHRFRKLPSGFVYGVNLCKHKFECSKFDCDSSKSCYEEDVCDKIKKPSRVCNGCDKKAKCRKVKYYYYAKIAQKEYETTLIESREGFNISKEELKELDDLISPLILNKHQSINHIVANHPDEIRITKQTLYNYINAGIFSFININLPRKVRYKKRKSSEKTRIKRETKIRVERTYNDFQKYISENSDKSIVEMDTVEGVKGGKVLLTLLLKKTNFMLIYLLDSQTVEEVERAFNEIRDALGKDLYKSVFEVILTDNGKEFSNPKVFENWKDSSEKISKLFFCDPSASWQKGSIEKNHEFIRYFLPKGTSFDNLNQADIINMANNINNLSRDKLENKTPYEVTELLYGQEFLNKLYMKKIFSDDVDLSPLKV